ncbi:MAG: class I SAM-dependent rRNA methyltransferase [Clostridia bacterium]|nr:class I SAM-dependent rRNA methyltransferase [Clostridia bacterium]
MKTQREFPVFSVTEKAERSLKLGHPWVYGEEATLVSGHCENGGIADIVSRKGRYLGTGFINDHSKILVRILSKNPNDTFDSAFFERRVRYALEYRKTVMGEDFSCCRLIFGEADGLPGLTVDRFSDVLVAQVLCLGIDQRKDVIFTSLVKTLRGMGEEIHAVYERNDVALREKEGLVQYKGFYPLEGLRTDLSGHVEICENGLYFDVDYMEGQKTGYFLDQKYNRRAAAALAKGRNVLDCFTHTGPFALCAAAAGANHVTAVDVSKTALEEAQRNAQRNSLQNISFLCADVFDLLTELAEKKSREYDFIILDPPAFTKSRSTEKNAYRGYKEINLKAMKLLPRGGYLATCSCSHFMSDSMFRKMLAEAASDAAVSLRQIEARQQAKDHPILWNVPETDYLKFYLFQIV